MCVSITTPQHDWNQPPPSHHATVRRRAVEFAAPAVGEADDGSGSDARLSAASLR
jgi:hypothetical protein